MTRPHRLALILLKLILAATAVAQMPDAPLPTATSTSQANRPAAPAYIRDPTKVYFYPYAGIFCGVGASTSEISIKPTIGCGVAFPFIPTPAPLVTEIGVMGPQANRSSLTGYVSEDLVVPLSRKPLAYLPSAIVGYSRLFETGNALDYGLAFNTSRLRKGKDLNDIRIELRDYFTAANPNQHNVVLRIGIISPIRD